MDDEDGCEECEEGAPAWLATFADLMSLLMCFFVLLLSFSEMDIQKYKQVAGSMKHAFGIQREIKADSIPKGTTVISQEYSPGKPEPTVMNVIKQQTTDDTQTDIQIDMSLSADVEELMRQIEKSLEEEIAKKILEVLPYSDGVMIRVREQDAFPSGSASLQKRFLPVLDKLVTMLNETDGRIIVAGHTDNVPIATSAYPSNWVLSSARAASVVHYLAGIRLADPARIEIRAYADTLPIVENTTPENRARNRRVEINVSLAEGNEL
jgi:chemotaxis protein MotB